MSKNLTRKGLVLGTVAALGASLFAGTPATAAPTALYLDTAFGTSGTSQVGVLGDYFTLAASTLGGASPDVVKFYVEGATAANITVLGRYTTSLNAAAASTYTSSVVRAVDNDAKTAAFSSPAWTAGNYYQFGIQLNKTNITDTTSIKVTPFLDSVIANDVPGANELTGTPVTINFLKGSAITATPTLTTVTAGAVVKAAVAVSGSVNTAQLRAAVDGAPADSGVLTVDFKETGADWAGATGQAARWNITDGVVRAVSSTATATASRVYGATAKVYGTASASATAATATAGEVSTLTGVATISGTSNRVNASGDVVRAGSGSISVKATVAAISGKSKANQTVTFTLSEASVASLPTGATLTAGGKTLTIASSSTTETIDVDVKSAADGVATLKIDYTGVTDAKTFTVAASAKGASGTVTAGTTKTITGQDSIATSLVDSKQSANSSAIRQLAKGGAFSVAYKLVDQFGQTPSGSYRVVVTNNASGSNAIAIASPVAVSSTGDVTVAGTDSSTADGTYTVTSTLQKLGSDGSTWAAANSVYQTASVKVAAAKTATTLTLTAVSTSALRNGAALVAGNTDLEQTTVARTVANGGTLSAVATDSYGANAYDVPVTFAAKGVLFKAGNVYSLDSITVNTAADGTTGTVNIYSNIVGDVTVSVTSGTATAATQKYTFAAATTGGSAWAVTAPSNVLPGTTLKVSAILTDAQGGIVDTTGSLVRITYTGPGYVTSTLPTDTDADGKVSFTVLLGAGDSGAATVKFEYANTNGFEETVDNDDVVKTATITIGAAPVVAAPAKANVVAKTKAFSVSVSGNASAKNVVVKVAGKTVATLKGSASAKTYTVKATKGSKKVTVYVGGKLIATKTVSVK